MRSAGGCFELFLSPTKRFLGAGFAWFALGGCIQVHVNPRTSSAEEAPPPPTSGVPDDNDEPKRAPQGPTIAIDDLPPRVASAREKLGTDPTGAARDLAAVRAELLARWSKLESTQPQPADPRRMRPRNPFYSDTLSKEGKDLLASIHGVRAGLWADQGKVDDALRELVTMMGGAGSVPCASTDAACQRARSAVSTKYKGFCWDFGSSSCSPRMDDDMFAFPDKERTTLFAQAWVKKVVPRGDGVDILTGDVGATDLDVCKGQFETDKILDVNEKRILIERTTWCREMAKQRRSGWRITHHLGKVPVALKAGDHVLVVADAARVRRTKSGDMINVDASSVLVSVDRDKPIYRWNETP